VVKWTRLLILTFGLLTACSKSDQLADDRSAPVITVQSPGENAEFPVGSSVAISGKLSDANRIVQVHLHISSLETGQLLMDIHRYPGTSAYDLDENFLIPATGEYRIQIIARDNAGNEGRQTITIRGI
jgi:hypothetical protein